MNVQWVLFVVERSARQRLQGAADNAHGACVGETSMGPLHSQHYLSIKAALFFSLDALIFSLIFWSSGPSLFHSVASPANLLDFFFHWRRTKLRWPRARSNFYFFHISVFRSGRFVNKFSDNETERFVTSSRLVWTFSFFGRYVWTRRRAQSDTPIESKRLSGWALFFW